MLAKDVKTQIQADQRQIATAVNRDTEKLEPLRKYSQTEQTGQSTCILWEDTGVLQPISCKEDATPQPWGMPAF